MGSIWSTGQVPDRAPSQAIPVEVTLTTAGTSQVFVTVPAGMVMRGFALNVTVSDANLSMTAGAPATTADVHILNNQSWGESYLNLPEGTYSFINTLSGKKPKITGVVWVGFPNGT